MSQQKEVLQQNIEEEKKDDKASERKGRPRGAETDQNLKEKIKALNKLQQIMIVNYHTDVKDKKKADDNNKAYLYDIKKSLENYTPQFPRESYLRDRMNYIIDAYQNYTENYLDDKYEPTNYPHYSVLSDTWFLKEILSDGNPNFKLEDDIDYKIAFTDIIAIQLKEMIFKVSQENFMHIFEIFDIGFYQYDTDQRKQSQGYEYQLMDLKSKIVELFMVEGNDVDGETEGFQQLVETYFNYIKKTHEAQSYKFLIIH